MKLFFISIIAAISLCFAAISCTKHFDNSQYDNILGEVQEPDDYPRTEGTFRVLTYNVYHCEGADGVIDYDRISGIINQIQPDVVCLQEVDSVTSRSKINQVAKLGELTRMHSYFNKTIPYRGGSYGTGMLSKEEPVSQTAITLPGKEPRSAFAIEYEDHVVINTHLALGEENRLASVDPLTDLARSFGNKIVYLAGDLNEEQLDGPFFTALKKDWDIASSSENTFPTDQSPTKRIDYILTLKNDRVEMVSSKAVYTLSKFNVASASDHYPVFSDFTVSERESDFVKDPDNLRLATYSVKYCRGTDGNIDYDRVASVINGMDADIICMQGLDSVTTRSGGVDQLSVLGEKTNTYPYFSAAIPYRGGKYGTGILTRHQPEHTYRYELPGNEARSAMVIEYDPFVVMSTQFDTEEGKRREAIQILTEKAKLFDKPVYLAGHFNDDDMENSFFQEILQDWKIISADKNTYTTTDPERRIDYIVTLKSNDTEITKTDVVYELEGLDVAVASDHFPVFCDFKNTIPEEKYSKAANDIRIATYGLKYCSGTDGVIDYDRIAGVINGMNADVVCVQAIDSATTRSNNVYQLGALAERTDMTPYFAAAFDYRGGTYGVGILTRETPNATYEHVLPGNEVRMAMILEYDSYVVMTTHFDPNVEKRTEAIQILTSLSENFDKPVYLAANFNDDDFEGEFLREAIDGGWSHLSTEKPTYPTTAPHRYTDMVFGFNSDTKNVTASERVDQLNDVDVEVASNHFPIYVDINLKDIP